MNMLVKRTMNSCMLVQEKENLLRTVMLMCFFYLFYDSFTCHSILFYLLFITWIFNTLTKNISQNWPWDGTKPLLWSSYDILLCFVYIQSSALTLAHLQPDIRKELAGPSLYLKHWLCSEKCQCSAKFTTYSLFTDGCGFCICSPLPLESSAVPGLSFDMCSVGAAIAA